MVIIEHTKHIDLSSILNFTEARKYGGSVFSFFQK
jgi:16S rRNA (guanine966-N2)-methyltransferase